MRQRLVSPLREITLTRSVSEARVIVARWSPPFLRRRPPSYGAPRLRVGLEKKVSLGSGDD